LTVLHDVLVVQLAGDESPWFVGIQHAVEAIPRAVGEIPSVGEETPHAVGVPPSVEAGVQLAV
jgi:hypothetical protein